MKHFYLKLVFFLISILIFIGCWVFLLFNHNDHLVKYTPAQAELYFHCKLTDLNNIPTKFSDPLYLWLEQTSSINKQDWQIINNLDGQIGFFTINNQTFAIVSNNQPNLQQLNQANLGYLAKDKVIYFPKLNLNNEYLVNQTWFMQNKPKFNFSKYNLFVKNINLLSFPLPKTNNTNNLFIYGSINNNQLKFTVKGLKNNDSSTFKQQIQTISPTTKLYAKNLKTSNISQNANYIPENFIFHLLKQINGPVEFTLDDNKFDIYALTEENDLNDVFDNIKTTLAFIYPSEKIKLLPDNTKSVQYIADPEQWQFTKINNYTWQLTQSNFDIQIIKSDKFITITNKVVSTTPPLIKVKNLTKNCSFFNNSTLMYVNIQKFDSTSKLNKLIAVIKNKDKTLICID